MVSGEVSKYRTSFGKDQGVKIESRLARQGDLRPASEVLGEAFADYPWTRWTVDPDDHRTRITELQLLALENLGLAFGAVWLSSLEGRIQSVAVWMDSAVPVPSSVYRSMDPLVAHLEGSRHDASLAAELEIEGWRPTERHFTLAVLGTAPASQRQGLGGRTLEPGLATADREGTGSFPSRRRPESRPSHFYSKFGFDVIGHKRLEGDGPDVWAMYREPLPSSNKSPGT